MTEDESMEQTVDRTPQEIAAARKSDRLRGWKVCDLCGAEYHRLDGKHKCREKPLTR